MKVTMTVPDELAQAADRLAKQHGTSRSSVCSRALREYVERHDEASITASYNQLIDELEGDEDSARLREFVQAAAQATLQRVPW